MLVSPPYDHLFFGQKVVTINRFRYISRTSSLSYIFKAVFSSIVDSGGCSNEHYDGEQICEDSDGNYHGPF